MSRYRLLALNSNYKKVVQSFTQMAMIRLKNALDTEQTELHFIFRVFHEL